MLSLTGSSGENIRQCMTCSCNPQDYVHLRKFSTCRVCVFRHEGRSWYTAHRGRLWIAATAKQPTADEIATIEQHHRAHATGEIPIQPYMNIVYAPAIRGCGRRLWKAVLLACSKYVLIPDDFNIALDFRLDGSRWYFTGALQFSHRKFLLLDL